MEGLVLIPALVTVLVDVVPVPIEWFQLVPILPPATLPVALVSGHVIASFLPGGFPNSEVETKQTTIGQRRSPFTFCCTPYNWWCSASANNNPQSKVSPSYVAMIKPALFLGML